MFKSMHHFQSVEGVIQSSAGSRGLHVSCASTPWLRDRRISSIDRTKLGSHDIKRLRRQQSHRYFTELWLCGAADAHRQHRLGAIQRLALALLVHAEHQGSVRCAQIQADHVARLLDDGRVVGQLEAFGAMGLQAKELKVPFDAGLGDPVSAATVRIFQCVEPMAGLVCSTVLINAGTLSQQRVPIWECLLLNRWLRGSHRSVSANSCSPPSRLITFFT